MFFTRHVHTCEVSNIKPTILGFVEFNVHKLQFWSFFPGFTSSPILSSKKVQSKSATVFKFGYSFAPHFLFQKGKSAVAIKKTVILVISGVVWHQNAVTSQLFK